MIDNNNHGRLFILDVLDGERALFCDECKKVICSAESFFGKKKENAFGKLVCDSCGLEFGFGPKYFLPRGVGNLLVLELNHKDKLKQMRYFIAERLLEKYSVVTHEDGTVYIYSEDQGIYLNSDMWIQSEIQYYLGSAASNQDAKEVVGIIRRKKSEPESAFDDPPNWIVMENVVYDVAASKDFSHRSDFISRSRVPVKYADGAECPKILKFVSEVLEEGDIPVLQEMAGYLLQKDNDYQKAFMFIGGGANGKSTLLNLLVSFIGYDNISAVSLHELSTNRFATSRLVGKLANIYPELSSKALTDAGLFKSLVGGDTIDVEQKYKEAFRFKNFSKLIFSCNKLPETQDLSNAFFRRWIFFNFPNTFPEDKCDPKLLEKLTSPDEMSGFLNWALAGLERLNHQDKFSAGKSAAEVQEYYLRRSSPVASFVMDEMVKDATALYSKEDLYSLFLDYCIIHDLPAIDDNYFGRKIKTYAVGIQTQKKTLGNYRRNCWVGYKYTGNHKTDLELDILNKMDRWTTTEKEGDQNKEGSASDGYF